MAVLPTQINGIPISGRTAWLLFAPIPWLANPKLMAEQPLAPYLRPRIEFMDMVRANRRQRGDFRWKSG